MLDPSQATIPGATVTVTNQETGYQRRGHHRAGGDYVVPNMPPGQYTVTVAAAGFKEAVSKDVVVIVDGLTTLISACKSAPGPTPSSRRHQPARGHRHLFHGQRLEHAAGQ